jgi:hypothetical protein
MKLKDIKKGEEVKIISYKAGLGNEKIKEEQVAKLLGTRKVKDGIKYNFKSEYGYQFGIRDNGNFKGEIEKI